MKKTLLILFVICFKISSFSQTSMPSGLFIRSNKSEEKSKGIMNFNPALAIRKGATPMFYHQVLSQHYTLFYVYRDLGIKNREVANQGDSSFLEMHYDGRIYKAMSSFFSGEKKFFIEKNHRLNGTIVNHFGRFVPSKVAPKMNANFLLLLNRPTIELYEVVLFPTVLSSLDYNIIHSYLSIKYAIPMPQSFDYVDIAGNVIWKAEENSEYQTRLMGLGREDQMELKQYQSQAQGDDFLIVGLEDQLQTYAYAYQNKEITDNSYFFVGDNGGSLKFEKIKGQEQLQRKWKIVNHNVNATAHFFFKRKDLEGESVDSKVMQTYDYYARVSAKADQSLATLLPLEVNNDTLLQASIPLSTAEKYVTVVRKQKVDFEFTYQLDCDKVQLKVNLLHGKLPYTLKVETDEGIKTMTSTTATTHFTLASNTVGKVGLTLEDAGGNSKRKELDAFDAFLSPVAVAPDYALSKDGTVVIAPYGVEEIKKEVQYAWYDAQHHLISSEQTLELNNTGHFNLEIKHQNHTYCSSFTVRKAVDELIEHKPGLYPNPVEKRQEFVVYLPLEYAQDAEVLVYTNKGQLLDYKVYRNASQILYQHTIATTGLYIIVVKTKEQKQFYRLVVK